MKDSHLTLVQPLNGIEDDGVGYGEIVNAVLQNWPWLIAGMGVSALGAVAIHTASEPMYQSSMQLLFEPNFESRLDLENLNTPTSNRLNEEDYATQINIMRSDRFLSEAFYALRDDYPELTLDEIQDNFRLRQVLENDTETRIFEASFIAEDPMLTQRFLGVLQEIYLSYDETQKQQRLERGLDHINNRLYSTRQNLREAQSALELFREEANVVDPSVRAAEVTESLGVVAVERRMIESELSQARASYEYLRQQADVSRLQEILQAEALIQALSARLEPLVEAETELQSQLDVFPGLIAEYDRLQPLVESERDTLQRLLQERETLSSELARGGYVWQVIEEPALGEDSGLSLPQKVVLGLIVGLFSGGIAAFLKESSDTVVRTTKSLRSNIDFSILGTLPLDTRSKKYRGMLSSQDPEQLAFAAPIQNLLCSDIENKETLEEETNILRPEFIRPIDIISNHLMLIKGKKNVDVVAITSALPGEGKTTVTMGMAYSLARMGSAVLVIDANLRKYESTSAAVGSEGEYGLSSYLLGRVASPSLRNSLVGDSSISFIPSGPPAIDPLMLLCSPKFRKLVADCRQQYDVVLIDTPHVLGIPDTAKIGSLSDGIVVVSRLGRVTRSALSEMSIFLNIAPVIGVVANGEKNSADFFKSMSAA